MKMKTMFAVVLSVLAPVVLAGLVVEVPVTIDMDQMAASGNMKSARFSANDQEQIGCGTRSNDFGGNTYEYAFCQARLDDTTNAFCSTDNPELVKQIRNINDYSYVTFRWDADGICRSLGFSTQSQYIPEYRDKKAK